MPTSPDIQAVAAMLLVACALFLFTREKIPLASSALLLLTVIAMAVQWLPPVPGSVQLTPADLFAGFGRPSNFRGNLKCNWFIVGSSKVQVKGNLKGNGKGNLGNLGTVTELKNCMAKNCK